MESPLVGIIVGDLLSAWPSQFVILALLGGFAFANALGSTLGIPIIVTIGLVILIIAFTTYAGLIIIRSIEEYPRVAPYLVRIRKKYGPTGAYLVTHAGVLGTVGVITFSTFLLGWEVTIIIAYLLDVKVSTAMKGTWVGLLIGALFFWVSYEGLMWWIPNPLIVTAIMVVIVFALVRIITYKAQSQKPDMVT